MFGKDNRLSLAASAIWRSYEQEEQELSLDGSGELGGRISRAMQQHRIDVVENFGFTPQEYNAALRERLCGDEPVGRNTFMLLQTLEVEDMEEYDRHHTVVCTLGYPGHPGAEYSTRAYLEG